MSTITRAEMKSVRAAQATRTQTTEHAGLALLAVLLAQALIAIDATIVNVALPTIGRDLAMGQTALSWVVTAYLVTFGSFLLVAGRLGDLLGRERVLTAGVALFVVASVACGLSPSGAFLIGARLVQGLGAALASSVLLALMAVMKPDPDDRANAMSHYVLVSVGGGSVALLLGGALTEYVDWRWIFLINVPVGALSLWLVRRYLPRDRGIGLGSGVDLVGGLLATSAALVLVLTVVEAPTAGLGSAQTLGLLVGSIGLWVAFVVRQARAPHPLVPLRLLRSRSLVAGSLIRALIMGGLYGAFFFGALLLSRVLGDGTFEVGLAFLPQTIAVASLSLGGTARVIKRFGPLPTLVAGLLLTATSLGLFASAGPGTAYAPTLLAACVVLGLGVGLALMPLLTIVMSGAAPADAGVTSGITTASMYLGGSLVLAVLTALADARTRAVDAGAVPSASALSSGYSLAFLAAAGLLVLAAATAVALLRKAPERRD